MTDYSDLIARLEAPWSRVTDIEERTYADGRVELVNPLLREAAAALRGLNRMGPDTPDNSMVICPVCTSQFKAISVDDQITLHTWQAQVCAVIESLRKEREEHARTRRLLTAVTDSFDRAIAQFK